MSALGKKRNLEVNGQDRFTVRKLHTLRHDNYIDRLHIYNVSNRDND